MRRFNKLLAAGSLALACAGFAGQALAQSAGAVTDDPAPPPTQAVPGTGGIQGQNIFDVKPEVKRDASSEPGYLEQNNAERNRVQPGNNAPMWRGVQSGVEGFTTLPRSQAPEAGVLIQRQVQYPGSRLTTAGEAWRQVRNQWIIPYGGALLLIVALAIAIFYFTKGPLGHASGEGGPKRIERFTPFERATHWVNAVAFVALAVSGIVMAFGKFFLLPIIGQTLFGYFTYLLKNVHNFVGPLFAVSLVIIVLTFVKDNIVRRHDFAWLTRLGGMFGGKEVPSHRFNAGEKGMFWWGITIPGIVVVGSGLVLDKLIPGVGLLRGDMQVAHMVHAVAACWMMALLAGHIYLGTIGMRGAYQGMKTGHVTDEWAREHHELWYDDIQAGKIPAQRSKTVQLAEGGSETVRPA